MRVLLIFFIVTAVHASQIYQDGKDFGKNLLEQAKSATSIDPKDIPGFQADKPQESKLDASSLGESAVSHARKDDVAQYLTIQSKDRQTFKIDGSKDPLFVTANEAIKEPEKTLKEDVAEEQDKEEAELTKTCEESGDEYQRTCTRHLQITLKITPEQGHYTKKWCIGHWKSSFWGTKWYCDGCRGGEYVIDQPRRVEVTQETWVSNCDALEDLVEKGLCRYVSKNKSPQETRTIQGEPITRDHFEETCHYACFKASPKSCQGLREQGCYQTSSVCKEKVKETCVVWEQTYRCPSGKRHGKSFRTTNKDSVFCLTGNCADTSYQANGEILQVMSQLSVLREAQNDLRNFKCIFKGRDRRCTRNCLDFRDCCGTNKGWGVSMSLAKCDAEEKELRTLRDKNRCVLVGTYCAEKNLGICTRKKTTFCCFGTKLARLIQVQGRAQLKLGWGTPEKPDCEGLSQEQLSRVDFSKIDFSEVYEDLRPQTKASVPNLERLRANMTQLTKKKEM